MFMAASNGLRSADVGREWSCDVRTDSVTHPFAGMTRIRFDGSEEKPLSQPLDCDPPENACRLTRVAADVELSETAHKSL
jgi:hypothetical protein